MVIRYSSIKPLCCWFGIFVKARDSTWIIFLYPSFKGKTSFRLPILRIIVMHFDVERLRLCKSYHIWLDAYYLGSLGVQQVAIKGN